MTCHWPSSTTPSKVIITGRICATFAADQDDVEGLIRDLERYQASIDGLMKQDQDASLQQSLIKKILTSVKNTRTLSSVKSAEVLPNASESSESSPAAWPPRRSIADGRSGSRPVRSWLQCPATQ